MTFRRVLRVQAPLARVAAFHALKAGALEGVPFAPAPGRDH